MNPWLFLGFLFVCWATKSGFCIFLKNTNLSWSLRPVFIYVFYWLLFFFNLTLAFYNCCFGPFLHIYDVCHCKACTDICVWPKSMTANVLAQRFFHSLTHSPRFLLSANHRRAGQAVTNILAKELTQGDEPKSSRPTKKFVTGPKLGCAESLEELLDAALTSSS